MVYASGSLPDGMRKRGGKTTKSRMLARKRFRYSTYFLFQEKLKAISIHLSQIRIQRTWHSRFNMSAYPPDIPNPDSRHDEENPLYHNFVNPDGSSSQNLFVTDLFVIFLMCILFSFIPAAVSAYFLGAKREKLFWVPLLIPCVLGIVALVLVVLHYIKKKANRVHSATTN